MANLWHLTFGSNVPALLDSIWDNYNRNYNDDHPALHSLLVHRLHKYFSSGSELVAVADDAIALLQPDGRGRWSTFLPSQSCSGPVILRPRLTPEHVQMLVRALCRELPGFTTLISFRLQDERLAQLHKGILGRTGTSTLYGRTTDVDTSGDFDAFWQVRSKSLRRSVRRRLELADSDGFTLEMRRIDEPHSMRGAIADYANLELSGWKRAAGTAVDGKNRQSEFYIDLLESFAERRRATVYQLLFNGKPAASLLSIFTGGIMIVLKTAYDEAKSRYSPGRLLDYMMLQDAFRRSDINLIENYTVSSQEDRKWCTGDREIFDCDVFSSRILRAIVKARRRILSGKSSAT